VIVASLGNGVVDTSTGFTVTITTPACGSDEVFFANAATDFTLTMLLDPTTSTDNKVTRVPGL
jgi:hypothetical protein